MDKNYLISEQILNEVPLSPKKNIEFVNEVNEYLKKLKVDNVEALFRRNKKRITAKETFEFFRSQERISNTKLIIQYFLSFLAKLPLTDDIAQEEVNPFDQIKLFVTRLMKLLKERDVRDAILTESESSGILNENNLWYYRGRIDVTYKEVYRLLQSAEKPDYSDYKKIFLSVQILSKFWFSLRNENIKQIRRSDLYLYKLATILIDKIDSSTEIKNNQK